MDNNFYKLLEVDLSASQEAIAASYKRLHDKFSRELSDGDEDATNQLIALREAYGTLSDSRRRQRYDEKLAARLADSAAVEEPARPFFKLLLIVAVIGACSVGYAKYQSEQEKARLERERVAATAKLAEVEAQKQREEKQAADEAELRRRRDENYDRYIRERDRAYGSMVTRNNDYAEAQARQNKQREEQQRVNEANQQLAREKAYLRQLEAANSRYGRY